MVERGRDAIRELLQLLARAILKRSSQYGRDGSGGVEGWPKAKVAVGTRRGGCESEDAEAEAERSDDGGGGAGGERGTMLCSVQARGYLRWWLD